MRVRDSSLGAADYRRATFDNMKLMPQSMLEVDAGAASLIVPRFVVEKLGLELVGKKRAELATGDVVILDVTEPIEVHLDGRTVTLDALMTGNEVLIGQMVLEATDMQVDCTKRRLIPNPAHPDGPVLKLK